MNFTRQLSEMSASELNDAIDDTNFPQAHVLSRGRNNSICSTSSASGTSAYLEKTAASQIDDATTAAGGGVALEPISTPVTTTTTMNRPKLMLKTNGIIPENDGPPTHHSVSTPMTPRTSTTPGIQICLCVNAPKPKVALPSDIRR